MTRKVDLNKVTVLKDKFMRLTNYEGINYSYDSTHIHAVDQVNGADRYDYDANCLP